MKSLLALGPSLKAKEEHNVQRQSDAMGQAGFREPGKSTGEI